MQILATTQPPAKAPLTPGQMKSVREYAALTTVGIMLTIVVFAVAVLVIVRSRRPVAVPVASRRKKPKTRADAWVESAKRVQVEHDDDTKDVDPEELGPDDVGPEHGPDDEPDGKRPPRTRPR